MEVKPQEDRQREFTSFPELQSKTDDELREIYLKGVNLHIHTSEASAAKRLLDIRTKESQVKSAKRMEETATRVEEQIGVVAHQLEPIKHVETVVKQFETSNKELFAIVSILTFFKRNWLPKQPLWVKISVFIVGTILLGIALNLIATWIALYIFHWR